MFAGVCLLSLTLPAGAPAPHESDLPSLAPPVWEEVAPGIEFARVEARRFVQDGQAGVAVVRLDPSACRIEPWHEAEFPGEGPATIDVWQARLAAPVVFNAGLYDEQRRHLGTFRREGTDLPSSAHKMWKGVLVAGGDGEGQPPAQLLDLEDREDRERMARYPSAVQSMMLFDRSGRLRVRRTTQEAARTVVAEDEGGRLLVVVTEGRYTLWEMAELLLEARWNLVQAIALDGGRESNLRVSTPSVRYSSSEGGGTPSPDQFLRATTALPVVVAVRPRTGAE